MIRRIDSSKGNIHLIVLKSISLVELKTPTLPLDDKVTTKGNEGGAKAHHLRVSFVELSNWHYM